MSLALSGDRTIVRICSISLVGSLSFCYGPRIFGALGHGTRVCISKGVGIWSYLGEPAVCEVTLRRSYFDVYT